MRKTIATSELFSVDLGDVGDSDAQALFINDNRLKTFPRRMAIPLAEVDELLLVLGSARQLAFAGAESDLFQDIAEAEVLPQLLIRAKANDAPEMLCSCGDTLLLNHKVLEDFVAKHHGCLGVISPLPCQCSCGGIIAKKNEDWAHCLKCGDDSFPLSAEAAYGPTGQPPHDYQCATFPTTPANVAAHKAVTEARPQTRRAHAVQGEATLRHLAAGWRLVAETWHIAANPKTRDHMEMVRFRERGQRYNILADELDGTLDDIAERDAKPDKQHAKPDEVDDCAPDVMRLLVPMRFSADETHQAAVDEIERLASLARRLAADVERLRNPKPASVKTPSTKTSLRDPLTMATQGIAAGSSSPGPKASIGRVLSKNRSLGKL